jgi:hypothetical protein
MRKRKASTKKTDHEKKEALKDKNETGKRIKREKR